MLGAMLRLAVVLLGLNLGVWGSELCLDDGVPEGQRKYIQDSFGVASSGADDVCVDQSQGALELIRQHSIGFKFTSPKSCATVFWN